MKVMSLQNAFNISKIDESFFIKFFSHERFNVKCISQCIDMDVH